MDYKTLPLAPVPQTQVLSSTTFKAPPLDGSMTLPEMYDWHLEHSPAHPVLAYARPDGAETLITWGKCVRSVYKISNEIRHRVGKEGNVRSQAPTVVAILSTADTITYFLNIAGVFRAGYTVFPISPRNSPAAVAHLLMKGNVSHVLVGCETVSQVLYSKSLDLLDKNVRPGLTTSALPTFNEAYNLHHSGEWPGSAPPKNFDLDCIALILHSSGSTAFPKPIYWTHYRLIQLSWIPYFGERDMCGTRLACHSMPMFHGMGVMQTGWTATSGIVITGFEPQPQSIIPNPDLVIESSIASKSDIIFCVPSFIEAWSRNRKYISYLCKIHGVLYGGGPLNQEVGDRLSNEGVSIFILYGSSEVGIMSPIVPKPVKKDWNYFCLSGNIRAKFRPDGYGCYELVVLPNPYEVPSVLNTTEDGIDAYATSDLLEPHPTKAGYWKVHGRVDDQIMHSNGEKTNPGPLETILNQDQHVRASVLFGTGRFNAGVIVDPKPEYTINPADETKLATFRRCIWPTVEKMNEYAPQHSRIFKEMILVSSPSKPFTYTAKNTARRQTIIKDYAGEIDALYAAVDETTQADLPLPTMWTLPHILEYVREVVRNVIKQPVQDDEDIFRFGCDSLQATWIRNTLLSALRASTRVPTRNIPINFVYNNPSVTLLATYVSCLPKKITDVWEDNSKRIIETMRNMALKYSASFKDHIPSSPAPRKDVVLVTGTTGGLGCLVLVNLLGSASVEKVYALNRRQEELARIQENVLDARGFDKEIIDTSKLVLLGVDFDSPQLSLEANVLDEIRDSVTHIIHCAYPVNFNLDVSTFEGAVATMHHIINLALSSSLPTPPRIVFASSVSVVYRCNRVGPVPEQDVDPSAALWTGYSASKWICEKVLDAASRCTPLKPIVVRIGQLSGMNQYGYWNTREWVPALIKSSLRVGLLPRLDSEISWIPVDTAAEVLIEMRNSSVRILHLAHPHPIPWMSLFETAAYELGLQLTTYREWVQAVSADDLACGPSNSVLMDNPALRIIDFFRSALEEDLPNSSEALGLKRLSLEEALKVSPSLRRLQYLPLTKDDMKNWLASWKKMGFITY